MTDWGPEVREWEDRPVATIWTEDIITLAEAAIAELRGMLRIAYADGINGDWLLSEAEWLADLARRWGEHHD